MGGYIVFNLFVFLVNGVFCAETAEVKQVMKGGSVTINTGVIEQSNALMLWYFNNTRIALINAESSTSCLYDGEDGRFRDRLEVDYKNGSLTITNIRSEHAGRYEVEIIRRDSSGTSTSLNRNPKCDSTKILQKSNTIKTHIVIITVADSDKTSNAQILPNEPKSDMSSGLSSGAVAGVVVAVLLVFASAVAVL